jgi:serine/threonine protein kinase
MLTEPGDFGTVKIVDFGLTATYRNTMFKTNFEKAGTVLFMAPE